LYEWGSKVSHSCLPNTRNVFSGTGGTDEKLRILSILKIQNGEPLTQLYGMSGEGTRGRQVALQSVYFFSCNCPRCADPTELGTNFSTLRCQIKGCIGVLTPISPRDTGSAWKCSKCAKKLSYENGVLPVLAQIEQETGDSIVFKLCRTLTYAEFLTNHLSYFVGMGASDALFSEFEFYSYENPEVPMQGDGVIEMKLEHVWKIFEIIERLSQTVVHPNHYAMLPAKTALIATSHAIFQDIETDSRSRLLPKVTKLNREVLEVMNVLQPFRKT